MEVMLIESDIDTHRVFSLCIEEASPTRASDGLRHPQDEPPF